MTLSVIGVIKDAHENEFIDSQKMRQIAVINNSDPHTLFELHNNKAYSIEDKHELIDNIVSERSLTVSNTAHLLPAGIRNMLGGDGKALLALGVGAAAVYGAEKYTDYKPSEGLKHAHTAVNSAASRAKHAAESAKSSAEKNAHAALKKAKKIDRYKRKRKKSLVSIRPKNRRGYEYAMEFHTRTNS